MGSLTSQMSTRVGTVVKGSICAVAGSGKSNMSDSSMVWNPRMEEPSKPMPSSNSSSLRSTTGMEKCCHNPGRSKILAPFSRASRITSFALMVLPPFAPRLEPRAERVDEAEGEGGLALGQAAVVLEEERPLRHVAAQLEPGQQSPGDLVLAGE